MNQLSVTAIIPAGGRGSRMGASQNKQYLQLLDKPILAHTWRVFARLPFVVEIILVVAKDEEQFCFDTVVSPYWNQGLVEPKIIPGGRERQDSVYEGLKNMTEASDLVLIHDGARPLVTEDIVSQVVSSAAKGGAAIVAVPAKDTIKVVAEDQGGQFVVQKTLPRTELIQVQTPQVFERGMILNAYHNAYEQGIQGTDDSMIAEYFGAKVGVVLGDYQNIKITTPEDLALAEGILDKMGE